MNILFDIGGTKMRVAGLREGEKEFQPKIIDTPDTFEDGWPLLLETIKEVAGEETTEKIVGGIAGPVDKMTGKLLASPNLSTWVGKPLRDGLADEFNAEVSVYNDTALVGLGEAVFGAGRNARIIAYITISTGVGGVRIVDEQIDEAVIGFEPGHQIINFNVENKGLKLGHLDEYVSGQAFSERFGKPAYEINDKKIWQETAQILALGLHNTILHWSPEVVVLGGSMMKVPGIAVEDVVLGLEKIMTIFPTLPEVKKASLGDLGGLYGAMSLVSGS